MNSIEAWTTFFGWFTVVNIAIYLLIVIAISVARDWAYRMNASIFGVSEEEMASTTLKYVASYKLLITVFCFAPWLTLKRM